MDMQIRATFRSEGEWNVVRLLTGDESIEVGRIRLTVLDKHPEVVQPWKDLIQLATKAMVTAVVTPHGGAVRGFMEVGPGEPLTSPEERN